MKRKEISEQASLTSLENCSKLNNVASKIFLCELTCFFARVLCIACPRTGTAGPAGLITAQPLHRPVVLNFDTDNRRNNSTRHHLSNRIIIYKTKTMHIK